MMVIFENKSEKTADSSSFCGIKRIEIVVSEKYSGSFLEKNHPLIKRILESVGIKFRVVK
jgi:hypothetical protein